MASISIRQTSILHGKKSWVPVPTSSSSAPTIPPSPGPGLYLQHAASSFMPHAATILPHLTTLIDSPSARVLKVPVPSLDRVSCCPGTMWYDKRYARLEVSSSSLDNCRPSFLSDPRRSKACMHTRIGDDCCVINTYAMEPAHQLLEVPHVWASRPACAGLYLASPLASKHVCFPGTVPSSYMIASFSWKPKYRTKKLQSLNGCMLQACLVNAC